MTDTFSFFNARSFKKNVQENPEIADKAVIRKQYAAEIEKSDDENSRSVSFVISTDAVDRDRDTIDPKGWDLDNYKKSPVVLFAHDSGRPPIGKGTNVRIENRKLKADAEFMDNDVDTSGFSDMIYRMIKGGYLNAVSVGFIPSDFEWEEEDEKRAGGMNFLKQELIEFSVVPVPSNPEALIEARSKGINTDPLQGWFEEALDNWLEYKDMLLIPRKKVEKLHNASKGITKTVYLSKEQQDELALRNLEKMKNKEENDEISAKNDEKSSENEEITEKSAENDENFEVFEENEETKEVENSEEKEISEEEINEKTGVKSEEEPEIEAEKEEIEEKEPENKQESEEFVVQNIVFPKSQWSSEEEVLEWAKSNDYSTEKMDETEESWTLSQKEETDFQEIRVVCLDPENKSADDPECRIRAAGGPLKKDFEAEVEKEEPSKEVEFEVEDKEYEFTYKVGDVTVTYKVHSFDEVKELNKLFLEEEENEEKVEEKTCKKEENDVDNEEYFILEDEVKEKQQEPEEEYSVEDIEKVVSEVLQSELRKLTGKVD